MKQHVNTNFNYSSEFYDLLNEKYFDNNIAAIELNDYTEFLSKLVILFILNLNKN